MTLEMERDLTGCWRRRTWKLSLSGMLEKEDLDNAKARILELREVKENEVDGFKVTDPVAACFR
jgi:hypothetical protein